MTVGRSVSTRERDALHSLLRETYDVEDLSRCPRPENFAEMVRTVSKVAVLVLGLASTANVALGSHLRVGVQNNTVAVGPVSVVNPKCDPHGDHPCKSKYTYITPDITESKYYDPKTGLFMTHELTSQEAADVKADVEKGVESIEKDVPPVSPPGTNGDVASPIVQEAKKEEEAAEKSGLGEYSEFIKKNQEILATHDGHRQIVSGRINETQSMVEKLKAELAAVRKQEDALEIKHKTLDVHTTIATLMQLKRSLDDRIKSHSDKLNILNSEQEQLKQDQIHHIKKIDEYTAKLDSVHQKIMALKASIGIKTTASKKTPAMKEEESSESATIKNAAQAKKEAGTKLVTQAEKEGFEDEVASATGASGAAEDTGSASGATGSATGSSGASGADESALAAELDNEIGKLTGRLMRVDA